MSMTSHWEAGNTVMAMGGDVGHSGVEGEGVPHRREDALYLVDPACLIAQCNKLEMRGSSLSHWRSQVSTARAWPSPQNWAQTCQTLQASASASPQQTILARRSLSMTLMHPSRRKKTGVGGEHKGAIGGR